MKNKYQKLFLYLTLLLIPLSVQATPLNDGTEFFTCIFMEAFVSIHMSVFVLFPISAIINKAKKDEIFIRLFIARVIILIIGNINFGMAAAFADFISVFIGAFIVVPIAGVLKIAFTSIKTRFKEHLEVDEVALLNAGIKDGELIKNKLLNIFLITQKAISENDLKKLREYCNDKMYLKASNTIKTFEEYNYKNIIEDIDIQDCKITFINHNPAETKITLLTLMSLKDYIIDNSGRLVNKSTKKTKKLLCELTFVQKHYLEKKNKKTKCHNCGAPINKDKDKCAYCDTPFNTKEKRNDWVLSGKKIISNKA